MGDGCNRNGLNRGQNDTKVFEVYILLITIKILIIHYLILIIWQRFSIVCSIGVRVDIFI